MKSMNSATPASLAPGVSSAGIIISARCSTMRYCCRVKNTGAYVAPILDGVSFAGSWEQAKAHCLNPGKVAATDAIPM
jgi:hypothetical protein